MSFNWYQDSEMQHSLYLQPTWREPITSNYRLKVGVALAIKTQFPLARGVNICGKFARISTLVAVAVRMMQIVKTLLQSKALSGLDFNLEFFLRLPSLETKEENEMTALFSLLLYCLFCILWNINCANIFSNYTKVRQRGKTVDVIRGLRRELTAFRLMNSIKEIKDEHFVFWRYDRCIIKKPLSQRKSKTLAQDVCLQGVAPRF